MKGKFAQVFLTKANFLPGAETMLSLSTSEYGMTIRKHEVEQQLNSANKKINVLTRQLEYFRKRDSECKKNDQIDLQ